MGIRRWLVAALALVPALLLAAACGSGSGDETKGDDIGIRDDVAVPAGGTRGLGTDLLKTMPDGNVVLGPYTVDMVLSMIAAGAKGQTLDELLTVLGHGVPEPGTVLASRDQDGMTLRLSATAWLDEAFRPEADYRTALAERFQAEARTVDFAEHPEQATDAINGEVSKATNGKIPKLLADPVRRDTVLVLVSAAYLLADWESPFDPTETRAALFTLADGTQTQAVTMERVGRYRTVFGDGFRAVELPYKGGHTAMLVVVPDDLKKFEAGLTAKTPADITGQLADRGVTLTLPKFEVRTKAKLNDHLKALGAPTMFDEDAADLSGIAPPPPRLVVDFVQHEAWIKVDEKGTEAAAATAGGIRAVSKVIGGDDFKVDRPFLYFIRDLSSGVVLFAGRVVDPTKG